MRSLNQASRDAIGDSMSSRTSAVPAREPTRPPARSVFVVMGTIFATSRLRLRMTTVSPPAARRMSSLARLHKLHELRVSRPREQLATASPYAAVMSQLWISVSNTQPHILHPCFRRFTAQGDFQYRTGDAVRPFVHLSVFPRHATPCC